MRPWFHSMLAAVACGLLAGCASDSPKQTVAPDPAVLRVGVAPTSPPMIFKEGGRLVGVEADLAESLGRSLGRRVVFVEEKWENLIDALCADQVDIIMSSMSITMARSYRIAFSEPYLRVGQMTLTRAGEKYNYVINLASQAKRGVGAKPGTTADFLIRQEFPTAIRKYYPDGEQAAEALLNKNLDLFISDAPMIWYLAGRYEAKGLVAPPLVLSQEQLGWGLRRSDTALLASVNAFLQKAQASGQLNQVMGRWMPGFR